MLANFSFITVVMTILMKQWLPSPQPIIQRCGRERDLGTVFFFFFSHSLYYFISSTFFVPRDGSSLLKSWLSLFQFVHHFWLARKERRITQQFLEMHGFDAGKMQNVIILCFVCLFFRLPHRLFEKWHFKLAAQRTHYSLHQVSNVKCISSLCLRISPKCSTVHKACRLWFGIGHLVPEFIIGIHLLTRSCNIFFQIKSP